ncbi:uncharacterized protein PAN0_001c0142 [Moesziomyces antarcticus]|uniref:uncharacterized protein n=1 Tax=Pseudozyma antarctica TaxID=84753 RepID=UPI000719595C|nr:uncharacterized protein PAN0_001c0142 [Moesziomyces antarcticus]GAK61947.1 conserved hypothetical protein [Moesziomyces antarcticus]
MPGSTPTLQHPGRSAPVRGVASQQTSTSNTLATSASVNVAAVSTLSPHQQHGQQMAGIVATSTHPQGWNRAYSRGMPAPAVAVPIFRASRAADVGSASIDRRTLADHQLPDSPPDTPPHSPGLRPVQMPSLIESGSFSQLQRAQQQQAQLQQQQQPRISPSAHPLPTEAAHDADAVDPIYTGHTPCDSELESDDGSDVSDDASQATLDQLTLAAQSLLLHSDASLGSKPTHPVAAAHRGTLSVELMPATPEISPDNDVRHHAHKSAHAFLHRIFADVPHNLSVEDAGVELVSPGWSGAVIKSHSAAGPASAHASSSFSSTSSSDSSADAQRTLYVSMPAIVDASLLREQVLAVLDAASEKLGCDSVMICLDRALRDFASVLHGLCYVGGALVAAAAQTASSSDMAADHFGAGPHRLPDTDPVSGLALRSGLVLVAIEL